MSFPSPSDLCQFPGFAEWLQSESWRKDFSTPTLIRSLLYVRGDSIESIEADEFWDEDVEEDYLQVTAKVRGSQRRPYELEIDIFRDDEDNLDSWDFVGSCSCPVGDRCKHLAATLGRLTFISLSGPGKEELSTPVQSWLEQLEAAAVSTSAKKSKGKKVNKQFLAYCIEPGTQLDSPEELTMVLRTATQPKRGEAKIHYTEARVDLSRPPAYLKPDDFPLVAAINRLHRDSPGGHSNLEGSAWSAILRSALDLGRLFYGDPDGLYQEELPHIMLKSGSPLNAEIAWSNLDDGSARPIVTLSGSELTILPVEPTLYLDLENHLVGAVESDVPSSLLNAWSHGPVLPAEDVSELSESLALLRTPTPLPTPANRPVKRLEGLKPTPHLFVRSERFAAYGNFEAIIGEVSYRYADSPKFFSLDHLQSPRMSWVSQDTRFVLDRDRAAEEEHLETLLEVGLDLVRTIFYGIDLPPELRNAVYISDPLPSSKAAWFTFLYTHGAKLRAEGWVIEVADSCDINVEDITDFVSTLEEDPDHGVDWFRFDIQGQFGEKQINLIPHIADAIANGLPDEGDEDVPEFVFFPSSEAEAGLVRFSARRFYDICRQVFHLFQGPREDSDSIRLDRLGAAGIADALEIDDSATTRALAVLGSRLRDLKGLPSTKPPARFKAELRSYQLEGFRWLQFLADNDLHGILADDMGLGKTVQTLALLAKAKAKRGRGKSPHPSLVVAPTSVLGNWIAESARFTPVLKTLLYHGAERKELAESIPKSDLVVTSYPLLVRDADLLTEQEWSTVILDEAQYIKNPKTAAARSTCKLKAAHRLCLSGTPMENHLGELWSLMRFLMPGYLGNEKHFSATFRRPIERFHDGDVQRALNRRVAPLLLRRTKDQVATDLPPKTELLHRIQLGKKETDLYESVRASMDKRVRDALKAKGLAKSHIIVLDALLKLRQICCHPSLLKTPAARKLKEGSKLDFLTERLLPELLAEGRRILLFSQFTSMLSLIEASIKKAGITYLKLTGQTKKRAELVERFQSGECPIFLISLKAGGTGLNLTAADTVIHYDPWWNPAAEAQATDRVHRIGQSQPVFVHKLICEGSIEERIQELQRQKSALVKALLSEDTSKLKIDSETLSHLLAPMESSSSPE